jgi:hypothetical protein
MFHDTDRGDERNTPRKISTFAPLFITNHTCIFLGLLPGPSEIYIKIYVLYI